MAIFAPGKRNKSNRLKKSSKRNVVAMLSLTAMVDMFTVLAVFLLQNYQTTGEVIDISDGVTLPKAESIKELRPSAVVVVGKTGVYVDKLKVATLEEVQASNESAIPSIVLKVTDLFRALEERGSLTKIREAVDQTRSNNNVPLEVAKRITLQADKTIEFSMIRKVMMSLTEAGAREINFAVVKEPKLNGG